MTDLDHTRAQLAQIPALAAKLPQFLTATTPGSDEAKIKRITSGSRPPVSVALLDLIQGRDIEWWTMLAIDEMVEAGTEPTDAPTSRTPSITENCHFLARHADWIQANNDDFAREIKALHWTYRRASGDLPGRKLNCLQCGNPAFIDGLWLICREVEEHARTVKSIENEYRYAPKEPTAEIVRRFPVTVDQLYQWKSRGKIRPAETERVGKKVTHKWWPWDILLALNPVLAEELEKRDTAAAG